MTIVRFVKKASSSLMKHMAQLEAAGLVKHSSGASLEGKDEGAGEVDIDIFITSVSALLKLVQVRYYPQSYSGTDPSLVCHVSALVWASVLGLLVYVDNISDIANDG